MTTPNALGFLSGLTKEGENLIPQPTIPAPRGFIGQCLVTHTSRFYSTVDMAAQYYLDAAAKDPTDKEYIPAYSYRTGRDGAWWYHYKNHDAANIATKFVTEKNYGANRGINTVMQMESILTAIDPEKWQNGISDFVTVLGPRGKHVNWVPFGAIWMPALVESIAYAVGYTGEHRVVDVINSINMVERRDSGKRKEEEEKAEAAGETWVYWSSIDDEFQTRVVGRDEKTYWESELGKARAELWAELGEPNPRKYIIGSSGQYDTQAPKLVDCLKATAADWQYPLWVRYAMIPNPIAASLYTGTKDGKTYTRRNTIGTIIEVFTSEDAAREAAAKDNTDSATTTSNGSGPAIPAQWQSIPEEWKVQVAELKSKFDSPDVIPAPVIARSGATAADFATWWELV